MSDYFLSDGTDGGTDYTYLSCDTGYTYLSYDTGYTYIPYDTVSTTNYDYENVLERVPIDEIERFLRKKKLERINHAKDTQPR